MPFICNNKDYQFVESKVEWDQLEYVVVRKLRVDFVEKKEIDIQTIRDKMECYGPLERIEMFRDQRDKIFAHVTFKNNANAYFAMKEVETAIRKKAENRLIEKIHPADARIQPDNPIDPNASPIENLTDNSLELIFRFCDIPAQARLGMVCKRFREVLTNRIWQNRKVFKFELGNKIEYGIHTAVRLIQCNNPKTFKISLIATPEMIEYDVVVEFDTPKISIFTVSACFNWIRYLYNSLKLSDKIQALSIKLSAHNVFDTRYSPIFNSVEELRVIGYASYMPFPDVEIFCQNFPNVRKMYFENGRFCHRNFIDYMKKWKTLDHFFFKECTFTKSLVLEFDNISEFCKEPERLVWIYVDLIREPIPFEYCACCGKTLPKITHAREICGDYCIYCGDVGCNGGHHYHFFVPDCLNDRFFRNQGRFVRFIPGPIPEYIANEKMN